MSRQLSAGRRAGSPSAQIALAPDSAPYRAWGQRRRVCRLTPFGATTRSGLRREWYGSRSCERAGEAGEDAEVGVKRDLLKPGLGSARVPTSASTDRTLSPRLLGHGRGS